MYGTTIVALFLLLSAELLLLGVLLEVLLCWLGWVNLCYHWFRAHAGNWQCHSAVLMCWEFPVHFVLCR